MLFLVHHARAVDALADPQRPISEAGRDAAASLALRARDRGVRPDVIFHSGKLRARQTAEIFWRACNPLAQFSAARGLQPDDPPQWIADVVDSDPRAIMLVGHMPHVGRLLAMLAKASPPSAFPPHGIVGLEQRGRDWFELWRDE
jgi:phosphohistidine phosphatase